MVSIIVPVYNAEKFLELCITSIINQSYNDIELILIDDGSTDNSGKICDEYALKDERITVFHCRNKGVSAARNIGLDNAKGKYIIFIDSDDYVEKNYVEELVKAIESDKNELAICGIKEIENKKVKIRKKRAKLTGNFYEDYFSLIDFLCVPFAKIFLSEIIEKNKIRFDEKLSYAEDEIFNLTYYEFVKKYNFAKKTFYIYNHRYGTLSDKNYLRKNNYFSTYLYKLSLERKIFDNINIIKKEEILGEQIIRAILDFSDIYNYKNFKKQLYEIKEYMYEKTEHDNYSKKIFTLLLNKNAFIILFLATKFRKCLKSNGRCNHENIK